MDPSSLPPLARALSAQLSRRAALRGLAGAGAAFAFNNRSVRSANRQTPAVEPATSHPRLWLTADDLPRLRGWATDANPMWRDGLMVLAEELTANMDEGRVPAEDTGSEAWEQYPTENYAQFFAFLSLVHPDEAARQDYAERARTLLMSAIDEAAKGPAEEPFRYPGFAVRDRSRWWGEAFPLTVDWIYDALSAEEKATIRDVFRRWVDENLNAGTTDYNHPEPIGVVNDPVLLADPIAVRWAGNNYFTAHMRNIGLMALAFDQEDDPDGELTGYVENATGAWLYMVDALLRGDSRGGLPAEGFEYSPQALGYVVQFLLALKTAGQDDPERWGPQVVLTDNPFWDQVVPGYLHSLSPVPVPGPESEGIGLVYQPAWYGDGQKYWAPDTIQVFGPLGLYDALTGNATRLDAIRWIQTHLPPGGADALLPERVGNAEDAHDAILYFLLFDPEASASTDPRPDVPLVHFAPGLGHLLVRTGWDEDATWFTYALAWSTVDHQHGDANQFEFYRGGEWLTKERTGYGWNIGSSDYHNTLALENDSPAHNEPDDYRHIFWQRGSQWWASSQGDPELLALRVTPGYVYALGDATNLYNSETEGATDVTHASRSIVWLPPDHVVVYDRAASKTEGRFKRFWLNLPAEATVEENVATMTTAKGQQLVVTTLLPTDAAIDVEPAEPLEENAEPAVGEPMRFRLRVEAPGGPTETRFLHVLQGADAGAEVDAATAVESDDGAFAGAVVGTTAVLFPVELDGDVREVRYAVPAATTAHLITGLNPNAGYDVTTTEVDGAIEVTVRAGMADLADAAGVLVVGELPEALAVR